MSATHLSLRPAPPIEPGFKPLLTTSLKLWWQHLPQIALTILPVMLPLYGLSEWAEATHRESLHLCLLVISTIMVPWPGAATLYGLAHRWNGQPWPNLFRAWIYALKRMPYLFFTLLKVQLWIMVGLIMLIVPGWKRLIKSSLAEVVVIMEPTDVPPLERSIQLVEGNPQLVTQTLLLLMTLMAIETGLTFLVPASWHWGIKVGLDAMAVMLELAGAVLWFQVYGRLK
jgi:hypothetical protein